MNTTTRVELDPDDWAVLRTTELRKQSEPVDFVLVPDKRGGLSFTVGVRRSDGSIEYGPPL